MAGVVVLDANMLIAAYNDRDVHHSWAHTVIADTLEAELVVPSLTYAEVLVRPAKAGVLEQFRRDVESLGFTISDVTSEAVNAIARVRAETNLRMPDALILQAALERDAAIATADANLAAVARQRGLTVYAPA